MEPGWRSTGARHPRQLGARVPGRQSDPPWEAPGTSAVTGIQNMGKWMEDSWRNSDFTQHLIEKSGKIWE